METIFHTLSPILLIVALGFGLARIRFLGGEFMADLNKLAFWIALPALLFRSVAHAERPGPQTLHLFGLMVLVTLIGAGAGWLAAILLRQPRAAHGTLSQAAFRGNLAYVGIPVLSYVVADAASRRETFASAVIVMTALMAVYNILAVLVLQASQHQFSWKSLGPALKTIVTNPLLLAGLAGLPLGLTQTPLPLFLDRTLEALGGAAVPIALLCIGGALATPGARAPRTAVFSAALLKTAALPALVWFLAPVFQLHAAEFQVALVLAASPTAAASYVMAVQMQGDEALAGRAIVLSTLLAGVSLPVVLWLSKVPLPQ